MLAILEDIGLVLVGAVLAIAVVLYVLNKVTMAVVSSHFWS